MQLLKRKLDLQAKVILVLIAVIAPTFVMMTLAESKLMKPLLEEEMKQLGVTTAKTLAAEIVSQRLLQLKDAPLVIEGRMQEVLYSQPAIIRMDVATREPVTGISRVIASTVEEDFTIAPPLVDDVTTEFKKDEDTGVSYWEIHVPIKQWSLRDRRPPKRSLGTVRVEVSTKLVHHLMGAMWKMRAMAAASSVLILVLVLTFFLRKTIKNDRLLRKAESQNLELTAQLQDLQRQLMNKEKLAVMGQLTASFAHEIGTPLNAIGGHLQLLSEELPGPASRGRLDIINGQLNKIEQIVKSFLQSTAKPASQTQLVDLNRLVDQAIRIVAPRFQALGVEVRRKFDATLGPVRVAPLDLEQVLLNFMNNSLDSLRLKRARDQRARLILEVATGHEQVEGVGGALVSVYDTGHGIRKADLSNVLKPFFTTKSPGEGTGLGLAICQQIARKYGGSIEIDSKENAWARVTLRIPYQVNV